MRKLKFWKREKKKQTGEHSTGSEGEEDIEVFEEDHTKGFAKTSSSAASLQNRRSVEDHTKGFAKTSSSAASL
eukprot:CAMPEP_0203745116 /NCGR_PEP_ID=MMETSP0098-20131031/964_1 /ASSEMBLY_ACC=CAM_ASM_000208 /TAXON_ID=96639 /ORGANISM=" , Strain NY0313808BC1" /LENGTH=72 /DNA_ID=CAMNT_0050632811 /DNA_START=559 /DNA_END=774 /DNA_ORIENTATION=+